MILVSKLENLASHLYNLGGRVDKGAGALARYIKPHAGQVTRKGDEHLDERSGIYRAAKTVASYFALDAYAELKSIDNALGKFGPYRTVKTDPRWRTFLTVRGAFIPITSMSVGYLIGHRLASAENCSFFQYLPQALSVAWPSLATRSALEFIGARAIYNANKDSYDSRLQFMKDYFLKTQGVVYLIDAIASPLAFSLMRCSFGFSYDKSILLNGKLTFLFTFPTNAFLYKIVVADKAKRTRKAIGDGNVFGQK